MVKCKILGYLDTKDDAGNGGKYNTTQKNKITNYFKRV